MKTITLKTTLHNPRVEKRHTFDSRAELVKWLEKRIPDDHWYSSRDELGRPRTDGMIDICGKLVPKEQAPAYLDWLLDVALSDYTYTLEGIAEQVLD